MVRPGGPAWPLPGTNWEEALFLSYFSFDVNLLISSLYCLLRPNSIKKTRTAPPPTGLGMLQEQLQGAAQRSLGHGAALALPRAGSPRFPLQTPTWGLPEDILGLQALPQSQYPELSPRGADLFTLLWEKTSTSQLGREQPQGCSNCAGVIVSPTPPSLHHALAPDFCNVLL